MRCECGCGEPVRRGRRFRRGHNTRVHGSPAKKGNQHHRWAGVRKSVSSHGYVKVRVGVDHPLADPNGWAYEHLVVWVAAGHTRPSAGEVIHHINEDRTDNRLGNLTLMRREDHAQEHGVRRDASNGRYAAGRLLDGRVHDDVPPLAGF